MANLFNPSTMEGGSFKQVLALARTLKNGSIGFDPNRGPKDFQGTWNLEAFSRWVLQNSTSEQRLAAWLKFTSENRRSWQGAGAKVELVNESDLGLGALDSEEPAEAKQEAKGEAVKAKLPEAAMGSIDWIVDQRIKAQMEAGAVGVDEAEVRRIVEDAMRDLILPTRVILEDAKGLELSGEIVTHAKFPDLARLLNIRMADGYAPNVWLAGPPGSGKSHAAKQYADARGMAFGYTGPIGTKYDLLGFNDATGKFSETEFFRIVRDGGVFLFDEIRGSVPSALLAFLGGLANRAFPFASGTVQMHKDCVIIVADNTRPGEVSADFNGGFKQDAALGSRFIVLDWQIDPALESSMVAAYGEQGAAWLRRVQAFRKAAKTQGSKGANVTPRAAQQGAAMLQAGFSQLDVEEMVIRGGMSESGWIALRAAV